MMAPRHVPSPTVTIGTTMRYAALLESGPRMAHPNCRCTLVENPMTEQEWLSSDDPRRMLRHLNADSRHEIQEPCLISDRKLRLFACAVVRAWWMDPDPQDVDNRTLAFAVFNDCSK